MGLRDAVKAETRGAMENGKKRRGRAHGAAARAGMIRDWVCTTPSKLGRAARWKTERSAADALIGRRRGRGVDARLGLRDAVETGARGAMENGKKRRGRAHGTAARARDDTRLGLHDAVKLGRAYGR